MFAEPSNETPPIVRAFANGVAAGAKVADAAFPVQDPEEPDTLPVTLPVRGPTNDVPVIVVPVIAAAVFAATYSLLMNVNTG